MPDAPVRPACRPVDRLRSIVPVRTSVAQYITGGREAFIHSTLIQDAVLRNLQIIGQSVGRLSETLCEAHPEIDWRSIIGLRNVLVHNYLGINLERIWDIIERDVPDLQHMVAVILRELGGAEPDQATSDDGTPQT
jgi:uncharacterized protein with HEPN domain